jgi:outer membrane protein assembly factor BamA
MEKRLANAGFLDAGVEFSDTVIQKRKYKRKEVYFSVKAGKRTTVSSIIIKGARRLDEKTIRGQMLHVDKGSDSKRAYNPERLQEIFSLSRHFTVPGDFSVQA